jgi:hypothetical protein
MYAGQSVTKLDASTPSAVDNKVDNEEMRQPTAEGIQRFLDIVHDKIAGEGEDETDSAWYHVQEYIRTLEQDKKEDKAEIERLVQLANDRKSEATTLEQENSRLRDDVFRLQNLVTDGLEEKMGLKQENARMLQFIQNVRCRCLTLNECPRCVCLSSLTIK